MAPARCRRRRTSRSYPAAQAILFCLHCDDVAAMHGVLHASGVAVGDITCPFYCPRDEFGTADPDGHACMVTHT